MPANVKTLIYPPGTCLVLECGEYSDYRIQAILITLKEVDLKKCAQAYYDDAEAKAGGAYLYLDTDDFPTYLITNGYAMQAEYQSHNYASYGSFDKSMGVQTDDC